MRNVIAALSMFALTMLPVPSFADCDCTTYVSDSSERVGEIIHLKGEVIYSGKYGFSGAKSGSKLYSGSQVSTGYKSSANVIAGEDCDLDVPENSKLSILPIDGVDNNICFEITREYEFLPILALPSLLPLSIAAGDAGIVLNGSGGDDAAGDAEIVLAASGGDNAASR
jgi:hypothetical protein